MEQPQKQKSSAGKLAVALTGLIITAVLSAFSQELLVEKTIAVFTSVVISAPVLVIWWLLWKSAK
jgi:hypothetical protein